MAVKVVFMGNPLGKDDGIGPFLYQELKDNQNLKEFELMELGVIGLDLISYVEEGDKLIIVDAVRCKDTKEVGEVIILGESDLNPNLKLVSQHDFGVEQTAAILRAHMPGLKQIAIVGIKVSELKAFDLNLSEELKKKVPEIKEKVVNNIINISKEEN